MNLNNLENLEQEMKLLGFDQLIPKMEKEMKSNMPSFRLYHAVKLDKGGAEFALHFKKSSKSDFYYLSRYDAAINKDKELKENEKYWLVFPPAQEGGKSKFKNFDTVGEAIVNFNKQETSCELAIGTDLEHRARVANKEDRKVNYVAKDFKETYYAQLLPQTFWVDQGKGMTVGQAINLMEGRAVYRDDLLSKEGIPYKAWLQFDNEQSRDSQNNLKFRHFGDPSYGFDLSKILETYKIKELEDPEKKEKLEAALKNGDRIRVTVEKDGHPVKVFVEAAVRYGQLNFSNEMGKKEDREQFLKPNVQGIGLVRNQEKGNDLSVSPEPGR